MRPNFKKAPLALWACHARRRERWPATRSRTAAALVMFGGRTAGAAAGAADRRGVLPQVRVAISRRRTSACIWTEPAIGNSILGVNAPDAEQVSVYEAAGGAPAMRALAHAWHQRCLADPEAQHPFSHPGLHPQHTERLAAYWGEMLGGPEAYSRELASVAHIVRIHSGNGPHPELDAATERCFALALDDAGISDDERLRSTLVDWFAWSNRVVNHTYERPELVPDDLTLPHWSWEGAVE
jgi:hemoglobin